MKTVRFGIIGCGLMGREFASVIARWCHQTSLPVKIELTAVCSRTEKSMEWFCTHFDSIKVTTNDYRELLTSDEVDVVYIAVPNQLHEEMYCETVKAGKHLFGEKPFGIDLAANEKISACIREHPNVFVRCSSEFPFIPAVQMIGDLIEAGKIGTVLEVNAAFKHSSDMNPDKPLNWKRMPEFNGNYGVMGDLGMHVCHIPFRAGWTPKNVRAILSNIMKTRPNTSGDLVPCDTWDNASLLCEVVNPTDGNPFPMTLKTHRICPGETDTWELEILGTHTSVRFSTKNINVLEVMEYTGGEQAWKTIDIGHKVSFPTITGGIFEFGFSDSMLQMISAFIYELIHGEPLKKFAGCATPEEASLTHTLFTAALQSQQDGSTITV